MADNDVSQATVSQTQRTKKRKKEAEKQRKCSREKQRRAELATAFTKLSLKLQLPKKTEKLKIINEAERTITSLHQEIAFLRSQLNSKGGKLQQSTGSSICVPIAPRTDHTLVEMKSLVNKVENLYQKQLKATTMNTNFASHCA